MCDKQPLDNDLIHNPVRPSIYVRTDYIVNSDMSIPYALAGALRYGIADEGSKRPGLPINDRAPEPSPLVLRMPTIQGRQS